MMVSMNDVEVFAKTRYEQCSCFPVRVWPGGTGGVAESVVGPRGEPSWAISAVDIS